MFRANDINGNSIFIDDAEKNNKYFCPACEEPLILKRGAKRKHYFSHYPKTVCKDNWEYEPMSDWHSGWQKWFNKENREVWIKGETESHRADIFINDTVIEFQHSKISKEEFNKRNIFYTSCCNNVVWVFDMKTQITVNDDGTFNWEKGSFFENTFVDFMNYNNKITIFFEIEKTVDDSTNKYMLPIIDFRERRYFKFKSFDKDITIFEFLKEYVDLTWLENYTKQRIFSISEMLKLDSKISNKKKPASSVGMARQRSTRPGPNEWYIKRSYGKKRR